MKSMGVYKLAQRPTQLTPCFKTKKTQHKVGLFLQNDQ